MEDGSYSWQRDPSPNEKSAEWCIDIYQEVLWSSWDSSNWRDHQKRKKTALEFLETATEHCHHVYTYDSCLPFHHQRLAAAFFIFKKKDECPDLIKADHHESWWWQEPERRILGSWRSLRIIILQQAWFVGWFFSSLVVEVSDSDVSTDGWGDNDNRSHETFPETEISWVKGMRLVVELVLVVRSWMIFDNSRVTCFAIWSL